MTDKNLFMLCTFWDFDFSSIKRYIVTCKNSNIYLTKHGAEMGHFRLFLQARCEVIVRYKNSNLLEHEWIRTGIRTLEAQIDEKNKSIEARENVTGSYKKGCIYTYQNNNQSLYHYIFVKSPLHFSNYSSYELYYQ